MIAILSAAAALLSGSAPAATPPPLGGTVAITPTTANGDYDPAMPAFVDAAGQALSTRGFTILDDPNHAAYVAELILGRTDVGTSLARDPQGAKVHVGPGVIVPLTTGKSDVVPLRRTRLELRIRKRGSPAVLWDGTAVTVRAGGTANGNAAAVAAALSAALLQGYPAEPRAVLGVP